MNDGDDTWGEGYEFVGEVDDIYDPENDERPLFGCACQSPLTVDMVCVFCVAYMQEQES